MNPAFSFCPDFYSVDFSGWAGDFCFKLVTSSKILVAMATKMVATWRVGWSVNGTILGFHVT